MIQRPCGISCCKSGIFSCASWKTPTCWSTTPFPTCSWRSFTSPKNWPSGRDLHRLSPSDREHLAGDVQRGYVLLIKEWLAYMSHLKSRYPYLFSLALRTNPFDPFATPEIQ